MKKANPEERKKEREQERCNNGTSSQGMQLTTRGWKRQGNRFSPDAMRRTAKNFDLIFL